MKVRPHTWAMVLLLALVSACGCRGDDTQPSVKILSPRDQHAIVLGETLRVESRVRDDKRISKVELRINGIQVDLYDVPEGEKSFRAEQSWLPPDAGTYHVAVIAYDEKGQESESAAITINVRPISEPILAISSPTPPPLTSTPGQASPAPENCTYNAVFVADVTILDNTQLAPGIEFVKTWRLRNSGTCDWGSGFQFVFAKGEQMGGPASINVPPTPAGNPVDISVTLQAPRKPGTYRGYWRMRTPDGRDFGDRPFVQIVVP